MLVGCRSAKAPYPYPYPCPYPDPDPYPYPCPYPRPLPLPPTPNSAKASSGINAWTSTRADAHANDTLATFVADTAKSALRDAGFAHTARMIALL